MAFRLLLRFRSRDSPGADARWHPNADNAENDARRTKFAEDLIVDDFGVDDIF